MKRKVGPPPDDVRDKKYDPEKHWSIIDGLKEELRKSGRSGIIIKVEPDAQGEAKVKKFLDENNCEGMTKKPYLVIRHDEDPKGLLKLARTAGLEAELFEAKK